jgi:pimeloyl-ACP methyl ester carboxylesterase
MAFISTSDGTRLYWHEWGEGAPLLFLSSLGMSSQMWQYQMVAFAEQGFRCICLDRRGHGRSDQPGRGYDYDTLADDVATLIADLDLTALTLVGHSMAGGEIVRYLTRHGDSHVARAILLGATTPFIREASDNQAGIPMAQLEALWAGWKQDYPKWVAEGTAPFFVPETSAAMMRWAASLLQQISLPVALACSRALANADFRREMREIGTPVLLIHGDRDRSAPLGLTAAPSARLLPNCRLLVYEGAPHGLIYTHMERLHRDMLAFIAETKRDR